jgi:hypothetical protein
MKIKLKGNKYSQFKFLTQIIQHGFLDKSAGGPVIYFQKRGI